MRQDALEYPVLILLNTKFRTHSEFLQMWVGNPYFAAQWPQPHRPLWHFDHGRRHGETEVNMSSYSRWYSWHWRRNAISTNQNAQKQFLKKFVFLDRGHCHSSLRLFSIPRFRPATHLTRYGRQLRQPIDPQSCTDMRSIRQPVRLTEHDQWKVVVVVILVWSRRCRQTSWDVRPPVALWPIRSNVIVKSCINSMWSSFLNQNKFVQRLVSQANRGTSTVSYFQLITAKTYA